MWNYLPWEIEAILTAIEAEMEREDDIADKQTLILPATQVRRITGMLRPPREDDPTTRLLPVLRLPARREPRKASEDISLRKNLLRE